MPILSGQSAARIIVSATSWTDHGLTPANTTIQQIAASATINTKGAYTQLVAATAVKYTTLTVVLRPVTANVEFLVDIALGAAGAEVVILPNLYIRTSTNTVVYFTVPASIPVSSRIAARCQCDTGASTLGIAIYGGSA